MKKILYINGNPQKEELSYSSRAGKYYLELLKKENNDLEVEVFNVYEEKVELIDLEILEAWSDMKNGVAFSELKETTQARIANMNKVLEQFKAADEYLVTTPLWNFGVTPMLKAYIDNVSIAGQTFRYTEKGPIGLMTGKKATIIQASGGIFNTDENREFEHGSRYLETVLNFFGIEDVESILIEGIAIPDKSASEKMEDAYELIEASFK